MAKCKNCLHLKVCNHLWFNLDKECDRNCGYFQNAADYAKPKQGHWVYQSVSFSYQKDIQCSVCGCHVEYPSGFCPNCGADMRGVDNG
jgi:hypothetical protein